MTKVFVLLGQQAGEGKDVLHLQYVWVHLHSTMEAAKAHAQSFTKRYWNALDPDAQAKRRERGEHPEIKWRDYGSAEPGSEACAETWDGDALEIRCLEIDRNVLPVKHVLA